LRNRPDLDEVNFWQPSGSRGFRVVPPGSPFFFKLKAPAYAIAGFGIFAGSSILPAWLARETFGDKNGAPDFVTMRRRIEKYRSADRENHRAEYMIGCLMVAEPIFFDREKWILQPSDWGRQTVQGASYDLGTGEGRRIWQQCLQRSAATKASVVARDQEERYGSSILTRPRLGQGIFRVTVTDAYGRACALTGEHSLPALEAAHIKSYAEGGPHDIGNGLLLRSDIHRLFDHGYVTVTPDLRFEVSRRLKEDFENGKTYYPFHGTTIHAPHDADERPASHFLRWHNENKYLG
jgi:putative restriction endonuclease